MKSGVKKNTKVLWIVIAVLIVIGVVALYYSQKSDADFSPVLSGQGTSQEETIQNLRNIISSQSNSIDETIAFVGLACGEGGALSGNNADCCSLIKSLADDAKNSARIECGMAADRCEEANACPKIKEAIEIKCRGKNVIPPDTKDKCTRLDECTLGLCKYSWNEDFQDCRPIKNECPYVDPVDGRGWGCDWHRDVACMWEGNCEDVTAQYNDLKDLYDSIPECEGTLPEIDPPVECKDKNGEQVCP